MGYSRFRITRETLNGHRDELMNANELNQWIENSPYTEQEEVVILLREQQDEIKDLQQQVAFLEDWRAVWAPQIRQLQGVTK